MFCLWRWRTVPFNEFNQFFFILTTHRSHFEPASLPEQREWCLWINCCCDTRTPGRPPQGGCRRKLATPGKGMLAVWAYYENSKDRLQLVNSSEVTALTSQLIAPLTEHLPMSLPFSYNEWLKGSHWATSESVTSRRVLRLCCWTGCHTKGGRGGGAGGLMQNTHVLIQYNKK